MQALFLTAESRVGQFLPIWTQGFRFWIAGKEQLKMLVFAAILCIHLADDICRNTLFHGLSIVTNISLRMMQTASGRQCLPRGTHVQRLVTQPHPFHCRAASCRSSAAATAATDRPWTWTGADEFTALKDRVDVGTEYSGEM